MRPCDHEIQIDPSPSPGSVETQRQSQPEQPLLSSPPSDHGLHYHVNLVGVFVLRSRVRVRR